MSAARDPFPVDSYATAAEHLRRPFHQNAIKFKVQSNAGLVVAFIDARLVGERLNKVIPHKWTTRFEPFPGGKQIVCHLTVDGLTRSDVGTQATGDRVDPVKAGYSDAFKRAAVHFGIGVPIYAMAQIWLGVTDNGDLDGNGRPSLRKKRKGNKDIVEIPSGADSWLREKYRLWVEKGGGKQFGAILDHGDEEGSVGDVEATPTGAVAGGEAVESPPLELEQARAEVEKFYEEKVDGRRLPKAKFNAQLRAASESEEGLAELRKQLEELTK